MDDISTVNLDDFTVQMKIGEGGFGEVFKIKHNQNGNIYAAKISLKSFEDKSKETLLSISREVNILSKIMHPSILRFIGYSSFNFYHEPKPVIITELLSNGSLQDIITLERRSLASFDWDSTRKLISIYGIASAMKYLHHHKIVHRDLKPENILMDDFLCPRIADFGLSKIQHSGSSFNTFDSTLAIKGTPLYISPEIWKNMHYSQASDVYAFGFIIYQIITLEEPFKNFDIFEIRSKVLNGIRPNIDRNVSDSFRNLIERCWSHDIKERPSFEEIVELLKTEDEFTSDLLYKEDFLDYVEYIDNYKAVFDSQKQIIPIDKFIKRKIKTFQKISININNHKYQAEINMKHLLKSLQIYPLKEYMKLNNECKQLVDKAKNDPEKQFEVGICLIEGQQNFPIKTEIGIKYLEQSIKNGNVDSAVYYSRMLIKAELIPRDLSKAESILNNFLLTDSSEIPVLYGIIKKKLGQYSQAIDFFMIASKVGNGEGQYEYGKLLYKGKGCNENKKEAKSLFEMAKRNGFQKSDKYIQKYKNHQIENKKRLLSSQLTNKIDNQSKNILGKNDDENGDDLFKKGLKYENGDGVTMNKQKAVYYYKMAIEKESNQAMYNYAIMLKNGDGIQMNKNEAIRYLKMAIERGNSKAMYSFALMLKNGNGITVNKPEAARYFKMAMDKGHADAMNNYALICCKQEMEFQWTNKKLLVIIKWQ